MNKVNAYLLAWFAFIFMIAVSCASCSSSSHSTAYSPMFGNTQHPQCAAYD